MDILQWVVAAGEEGLRLDAFLAGHLSSLVPSLSRREIAELITARRVRVNGRPSKKGERVCAGDTVTAPAMLPFPANAALPIRVVYAEDTLVVLDKAAGIPSIALRHSETDTVANFLAARFPETVTAGPRPLECGLLQRLDTATSGLLLAARTPDAYASLRRQLHARTVEKQYLAVVEGHLHGSGQVTARLVPSGPRGRHMRVTADGQGQEANTAYVPVAASDRYTLLRITITTGVRHQIRVHLAALGHPIVGDAHYGAAHGASRLYLHAAALAFTSPATGQRAHCTSPAPQEFAALVKRMQGMVEG
ncbi:MAG TPA: RluA family pseudouridine synthase [Candidatus Binatia bacterium]|jgi:23S rRNA pseudouridine1911/1915/1917 synthase|nr:RluA family pseudouridine synthase [Candidatus Binatia bacterium]